MKRLGEQGCAENKNPNSIKISWLVIFILCFHPPPPDWWSWDRKLGKDTNGQKEMVNEWNIPGYFKGMLIVRKNNFIKDMEDKGGHLSGSLIL